LSSKTPRPKRRPRVPDSLLKWALDVTKPEPPETGHLDDGLIERLATPDSGMSAEERQPALNHLAICSICWAKVAQMLDEKVPRVAAACRH
jgi:hypothetical protein